MVGNIGWNYIVRFHEEVIAFFVSRISYCILMVYIVSHPCTELPFLPRKQSRLLIFSFWVKDDDCLGTLASCEKYL